MSCLFEQSFKASLTTKNSYRKLKLLFQNEHMLNDSFLE